MRRYRVGLDEEDMAEEVLHEFEENQEESWTAVNFAGAAVHATVAASIMLCAEHISMLSPLPLQSCGLSHHYMSRPNCCGVAHYGWLISLATVGNRTMGAVL